MEINPINETDREIIRNAEETVYWSDPRLKSITRFRMLTDTGFPLMDVSYCYGILRDDTPVRVSLPFDQLPKRKWKASLVEWAKRDGVHAARLGMFDNVSILF